MMQQTSLLTYSDLKLEGVVSANQLVVLDGLKCLRFATDLELCQYLNFSDPNVVRPRRNELVRKNLVKEYGKRRCRVSGRTSIVWGLA